MPKIILQYSCKANPKGGAPGVILDTHLDSGNFEIFKTVAFNEPYAEAGPSN